MTQSLVVLRAFGNDLSKIQTDTFLPQILQRMDERTPLVRLMTINTADESRQRGEVLTVKKPQYIESVRHQTAAPSIPDDINADTVKLELTEHIYLETQVSDRDFAGTLPGFLPDQILAMSDAMGRTVNKSCMSLQKQVARASGIIDSDNERSKYDMIVGRQTCNKMKIWDNKNLVLSNDTSGEL